MPVTLFHFGPAAIVKAVRPRHFSFVAFGLTQVIIDAEVLYYMARGLWPIHRFFHTYLGVTVVAAIVIFLGKPVSEAIIRMWNWRLSPSQRDWLEIEPRIPLTAAATGALFGGYSHVFMDSIMHSDLRPFAPLSDENALLKVISLDHLHILCASFGVLGGAILLILLARRKIASEKGINEA